MQALIQDSFKSACDKCCTLATHPRPLGLLYVGVSCPISETGGSDLETFWADWSPKSGVAPARFGDFSSVAFGAVLFATNFFTLG